MTGVRLSIDAKGLDATSSALSRTLARVTNARPMFENIGMAMVNSTLHRFDSGTAPDGSVWPPSIRALTTGGKTLVLTSRLMRSITYIAGDAGVQVGSNVVYAAIHQFGGAIEQAARSAVLNFRRLRSGATRFAKAGRATFSQKREIGAHTINIPARPYLGVDDTDAAEIEKIAENYIDPGGAP